MTWITGKQTFIIQCVKPTLNDKVGMLVGCWVYYPYYNDKCAMTTVIRGLTDTHSTGVILIYTSSFEISIERWQFLCCTRLKLNRKQIMLYYKWD